MEFGIHYFIVLLCVILNGQVNGYPNSVPESPDVCSKMTPGHGPRPQQTPSPFKIILNKQEVTGGNKLEISIVGRKGATFKGFYIQARDEDGKPIGTFLSPDEKESAAHNCFKLKKNAIHHKNNNPKKSMTVYWKAPENYEGKIKVIATVLKDFETYWTNVQANELVSVSSSSSKIFFTSSGLLEKETEGSSDFAKTARILNYNPYSPISQLSPWDSNTGKNVSSSEFLVSEPSDENTSTFRERQLFGPNFDFHGGLYSSKIASLKNKGTYPIAHPALVNAPKDYNPHSLHFPPNIPDRVNQPPVSIQDKLEGHKRLDIKERHPLHLNPKHGVSPLNFPPVGAPYPFYPQSHLADIHTNPVHHNPTTQPIKFEDPSIQNINGYPEVSQSIYDKGGHYFINQHHLPNPSAKPYHHQFYHPHHEYPFPSHKPASDPSYPNSGYFPKDILTKLTSYIPNIYNALTNNPLFNFNVDNTIESIWKPSKGVPTRQEAASVTVPTKIDMPKFGYLIYNPVRGDPFLVLPAANEEEFVANHMRREGKFH